ncbi:MAG: hypothetical protein ACW963_06495 [Candidatus Sifarchaeia archaeon]|jgi:hypothetical protein
MATHVPNWSEIRGYFTETDIAHMKNEGIDLSDCKTVLDNAQEIWNQVSQDKMPPGDPWDASKKNGFYSWWKMNPNPCG